MNASQLNSAQTLRATPLSASIKNGLVLSGGGARAAYQVGVIKALAELYPRDQALPFQVLSGTSAGALNASALAAHAQNFDNAVEQTCKLWSNLKISDVYRTGSWDIVKAVLHIAGSLLPRRRHDRAVALLDSAPLWRFIRTHIPIRQITENVNSGLLHGFGITASSYASNASITFYEADTSVNDWAKGKRYGVRDQLMTHHLIASSAIPGILPAVRIGDHYYGDGALRQVAPLSAALHLGATRLMVIGVSHNSFETSPPVPELPSRHTPSLAGIMGHVFNSAFIDAFESDIENLMRINTLLSMAENSGANAGVGQFKKVDILAINPSEAIDTLVERHILNLPRNVRILFNLLGATQQGGGASMASYLMFDGAFCADLIALGYRDGLANKDLMLDYFRLPIEA